MKKTRVRTEPEGKAEEEELAKRNSSLEGRLSRKYPAVFRIVGELLEAVADAVS